MFKRLEKVVEKCLILATASMVERVVNTLRLAKIS